ncbi:LysR family transcriptional regulator [Gymnodinialimonas hymeniacidonis]|uniref:LysR family transcriptional regulator n=1 Tax=Gymnodinialimonas hymeniacidonis TaxID=3126508 RepID=UPI0034C636D0
MRHLKMYRAIQMIHRSGSIRRAAQDLAVSPSALNRSVQAFEEELSFTVFQRTASGVELSEAGELLLNVIDRHLIEFGELQRQLGRLRDGETGELRVSVGSDLLAGQLSAAIADMETDHPGFSIEVRCEDGIDSLRRRQVDLALLTNPVTDDATEVVHAQSIKLVAWKSEGQNAVPSGLWDLAQTRVLLPPEGTGSRVALIHLLRRNRLELNAVSSQPASQAVDYLGHPDRIVFFPEIILPNSVRRGQFIRLPWDLGEVQLCVLRSARVPMTRAAQLFLTSLQLRLVEMTSD